MIGIEIFYTNPISKEDEIYRSNNVKRLVHGTTLTTFHDVEKNQHITMMSKTIDCLNVYEVLDEKEIISRYLALANDETLEDIARED